MRELNFVDAAQVSGGWYASAILEEASFGALVGLLAAATTPGLALSTGITYGAAIGAGVGFTYAVAFELDYYLWTNYPL